MYFQKKVLSLDLMVWKYKCDCKHNKIHCQNHQVFVFLWSFQDLLFYIFGCMKKYYLENISASP